MNESVMKPVRILQLLILGLLAGASFMASADVEGYQDYQWNMSSESLLTKIKSSQFCNAKDKGVDKNGIQTISCDDFPFAGEERFGYFLLIDDKLLRVGITIRAHEVGIIGRLLSDKYKSPSSGRAPVDGVLIGDEVRWDNDTIIMKRLPAINTADEKEDSTLYVLIYTSKEYEHILIDMQKKKFKL